jgi:hypothetical protein
MTSDARIPVGILEGAKTRPIYMQLIDPYQLFLYDTDTARRPRSEINLQQSICEQYAQDVSGRAISIISPSTVIVLSFSSAADANSYLTLFNGKSDIVKDRQSMQHLDRTLEANWPFPLHE